MKRQQLGRCLGGVGSFAACLWLARCMGTLPYEHPLRNALAFMSGFFFCVGVVLLTLCLEI